MLTVDRRCNAKGCGEKNIYRMVGSCSNCHTQDLLMLFTAEHPVTRGRCPVCGCDDVRSSRLATEDEIPA